jgi:Tfp pilus assembly protein PilF
MKSNRLCTLTLAAIVAASLATGIAPARAGILWVDNANESINVPLESPTLGLARAKDYIEQGNSGRAEMALKKIVAKFPTATEAHRLLAGLYRDAGKTELAAMHEKFARATS